MIGTFSVNVSKLGHCLLVHVSGTAVTKEGKSGISVTSCVDVNMFTIEEKQYEYSSESAECRMYFGSQGTHYFCSSQVNADKLVKLIPMAETKHLVSEGANIILQRQLALRGFHGTLMFSTILGDGHLCPTKYTCERSTVSGRDGRDVTVTVIEQVIEESQELQRKIRTVLTCTGGLLQYEWLDGSFLARVSEPDWQEDMQLKSCYLDHKRVARQACPLHVVQNEYLTTTREQHNHKYEVHKDTDVAAPAVLSVRQDFVRNVDEKLRMTDWFPPRIRATEYSTQFIQKEVQPMVERVLAPARLSVCRSRGLGRGEQPAVPPDANSFAKYLDPYVSTTQQNHTQFRDAQLRGIARNDAVTFWRYMPPDQTLHREPLYDQLVFQTKTSNRMIPRPICPIPHRSVQKEVFTHPCHREFSSKTWNCGVEVLVTVLPPSSWETLSVPYMYCTEHCHIGTGQPVRQVVDPGVGRFRGSA